jgi:hypothetical protein
MPSDSVSSRAKILAAAGLGRIATPLLLRLGTGRWPDARQRAAFQHGFARDRLNMPPLLRGLLAVPTGHDLLRRAVAYDWHDRRNPRGQGRPPDLVGNLYTAWTGPGLSFLHLEKCGGVAVMRYISSLFHPEQINPDNYRDLPPHLCYRTPEFLGLEPARYPLIWGHYDLPTLQRLAPRHLVFTLLREPQARLLSLYHFWRSVSPGWFDPELAFAAAAAHRLSLEDFLNCDDPLLLDVTDNLYVRRLTGLYATGARTDPLLADPQAALRTAMDNLQSLAFVGISERMNASLTALAARIGTAPPAQEVRANVTAENHTAPDGSFRAAERAEITQAAAAALQRRTALDAKLYARALERSQ